MDGERFFGGQLGFCAANTRTGKRDVLARLSFEFEGERAALVREEY
jgi:hypothetical protein